MAKKAKPPEPAGESAPMWIVSFADLVTLLMSFFVVLYALKQGGTGQQQELAAAIKKQFGYVPPEDSDDPVDMIINQKLGRPLPPMQHLKGRDENPPKGADGRDPEVTKIRDGKEITSGAAMTFKAGDATITPESERVIRKIADIVRGHTNILMIKGHVSADELSLHPDDANGISLSTQRSLAVGDMLVKLGIDRRVIRPVACGPFEPLRSQSYTPEALAANRRVEIYSTEATETQYFPAATVPATETAAPPDAGPASAPATQPSK